MYVDHLKIKNYRNYKNIEVDFHPHSNLFLGANAQGKTNLLEAIYLSTAGKPFRPAKDAELIRFGASSAYVLVHAVKKIIDTTVEIRIERRGDTQAVKYIKKDKKNITLSSQLIKNIMAVVFSPEDLKIVKDEPDKRRSFINRELSLLSPLYLTTYVAYRKTLLQRNAYLKETYVDPSILGVWDERLATYGAKTMIMRGAFLSALSGHSARLHREISGGLEDLKIQYEASVPLLKEEKDQKNLLLQKLQEASGRDRKNRTTSVGPHRDDISFYVNGVDMRKYGSQGQQRTSALSLKLAELNLIKEETEEDAILLLDDVLSELDESRRIYLFHAIKESQLFITGTDFDPDLLEKSGDRGVFSIESGSVRSR